MCPIISLLFYGVVLWQTISVVFVRVKQMKYVNYWAVELHVGGICGRLTEPDELFPVIVPRNGNRLAVWLQLLERYQFSPLSNLGKKEKKHISQNPEQFL